MSSLIGVSIPVILNHTYYVPEDLLLSFTGEGQFETCWTEKIAREVYGQIADNLTLKPVPGVVITGDTVASAMIEAGIRRLQSMEEKEDATEKG